MSLLKSNIRLLIETVSLEDLDYDDIHDIINVFFRSWLQEKKPEINQKRFAITYLQRRYFNEFLKDIGLLDSGDQDEYDFDKKDILRHLLSLGRIELPLYHEHETKFLETYRKNFEFLVKRLDLPKFVKLEFTEPKPFELECSVEVDFESWIKSNETFPTRFSLDRDIERLLQNYMGIEVGESRFGGIQISVQEYDYVGYNDWVKNIFPKIKKEIKQIPKLANVRAIRGKIENNRKFIIGVSFVSFSPYGYLSIDHKKEIREIWKNHGYSEDKLGFS